MEHLPPRGFGDLATKGDLELLRVALKADIGALRSEFHALRAEFDTLRAELDTLRAESGGLRHELRGDIERSARQLMAWVSGMVLATGGLAFAAARFV